MSIRMSGEVYGDLTGSIFEPQVKSIANVTTGTLAVANGGTGKSVPLVNDSSTTGITIDSATASLTFTDSGHTHSVTDSGHSHSVSSSAHTHAVNDSGHSHTINDPTHTHDMSSAASLTGSLLRIMHETWKPDAAGTTYATVNLPLTVSNYTTQLGGPRTLDVVFKKDWNGGNLTISGTTLLGESVSETYIKTAVLGTAQTVTGSKVFAFINTNGITNTLTGGPNAAERKAEINISKVATSTAPVNAFLKVSIDGNATTFTSTDTVSGAFDTAAASGNKILEVWYTAASSVTVPAHTHTLSGSSTGVTADSNTTGITLNANSSSVSIDSNTTGLSVNSNTTGISGSTAGHTHALTDSGHTHTHS